MENLEIAVRLSADNPDSKIIQPTKLAGIGQRGQVGNCNWYWGNREFSERVLKIGESVLKKPRHARDQTAKEIRAHGEQEAQRLIREGLAAAGLGAEVLKNRPGSDPIKSVLAEIVWSRTSVNVEWIAQALNMRSAGNVRQQIHRRKTGQSTQRSRKAEKHWTREFKKWLKQ